VFVRLRTRAMIYDLLEPRYRAIASEVLYDYYVDAKTKLSGFGKVTTNAEHQYQELHLRMAAFDPYFRRKKEDAQLEALGSPPGTFLSGLEAATSRGAQTIGVRAHTCAQKMYAPTLTVAPCRARPMAGAFPLDELPPELRKLIVSHMYALCKPMTVRQLCVLRLVNVRMAQAFYKRCIMLVLSRRYTPILFPLCEYENEECTSDGKRFYYPLHDFFCAPALLPQRRIDALNPEHMAELKSAAMEDKQGQVNWDYIQSKERFALLMLYMFFLGSRPLTERNQMQGLLQAHREEICVHLYPQEVQLFGLRERPTTRPKAMDPNRETAISKCVGFNHTWAWGRFPWM
tara:strand:+ start:1621 stop:2655 length:1035 start_codon:yes stop_codon:yes gene_type:complete